MLFKELSLKQLSATPVVFILAGIFTFSWSSYGADFSTTRINTKEQGILDDAVPLSVPHGYYEKYPLLAVPRNQSFPIDYDSMPPQYNAPWDPFRFTSSNPMPSIPHQSRSEGIIESEYPTPLETMPEGADIGVLVLGQTGSGKTTFLNTAANYFLFGSFGVEAHDQKNVKVIIPTKYLQPTEKNFSHSEHNVKNQAKSQTKKPKPYRFSAANRTITFIDTPGLGDTDGIDEDDEHLTQILKKAAKHKKLAGIILFFNGAEPRDTTTKIYAFNKLKGAIPDIALKNMIVVLTNTYKESSSFPIDQIIALGVSNDRIFYMNNSLWASDPTSWRDREVAQRLTLDWRNSMTTIGDICSKLSASSGTINKEFKRMLELRDYVMNELHKVRLQFAEMESARAVIETFRDKYQSENAVAENFKDFAQKAKIKTRKFVPNPDRHYSTMCQVHHTTCHDECSLNETHTVGDKIFTGCAAFTGSATGSRCGKCSSGDSCSYKNHYHARGKFELAEETLQNRLDKYKKRYEKASQAAQSAKEEIDSAESALGQTKATIESFAEEVKEKLEDLKKICSGYNFVAELNSTIELLKQETRCLTSTEALDSANAFIAYLQTVANELTDQGIGEPDDSFGFGYQVSAEELNDAGPNRLITSVRKVTRTANPISFVKKGIAHRKSSHK